MSSEVVLDGEGICLREGDRVLLEGGDGVVGTVIEITESVGPEVRVRWPDDTVEAFPTRTLESESGFSEQPTYQNVSLVKTSRLVRFATDDLFGLWQKGDLAEVLGNVGEAWSLRMHRTQEIILLHDPYARGHVEEVEE